MTPNEKICDYLKDLPSKWKDQLAEVLCEIKANKQQPSCDQVKDCETLTILSPFSISGTVVSIRYKDERGIEVTRSFDTRDIINNILNELDPNCLASESEWLNLSAEEKLQLLVDSHCECCSTTTTTTTTIP